MYQQYFGLTDAPFSISPDPRYLYLSDKHREALAHLIYGVGDQGGFVVLTGEVGTGKTTICRCLLQQVPDNADIAFIINPKQSSNQLLQSIFTDLGVDHQPGMTTKELIDQLNHYLLDAHARGRNTILIIDEAQNLSEDVLEQLRLLTNLETNEKKLLQLVLLGQPELNTILEQASMRQLAQRVTARYHLNPLSKAEVADYVQHRLAVAGTQSDLFSTAALNLIFKLSGGIPRIINLICDRSLLGVYANNHQQVNRRVVNNAKREIIPTATKPRWKNYGFAAAVCVPLMLLVLMQLTPAADSDATAELPVASNEVINSALEANPPAAGPVDTQTLDILPTNGINQLPLMIKKTALEQLYLSWFDRSLPRGSCEGSEPVAEGIYCTQGLTELDAILAYNRPALLKLSRADGAKGWLLLLTMSDENAVVQSGSEKVSVSMDVLARLQIQDSMLLSRIPSQLDLPVRFGAKGSDVAWLDDYLFNQTVAENNSLYRQQMRLETDINQQDFASGKPYSHYSSAEQRYRDVVFNHRFSKKLASLQQRLGLNEQAVVGLDFLTAFSQQEYNNDPVLRIGEAI